MKLSALQKEYIREANARWNLKVGAVRSGKTFIDIAFVIPYRLRERKDKAGLNVILGVSKETIERNVLQPMREIYTSAIVGTINSRNIAIICGVPVYCLGAAKSNQVAILQGSSIKYCYGDEIAKWNEQVFDMLKSRLDKPYSCFDGACNPEYPSHWLKQFIDDEEIDSYIQKYTLFDNPFLSKDFVENLCTEYQGTVYYNRLVLGEWALAEGLIYPMYQNCIAEAPDNWQKKQYKMYLSIDYGTLNAFAALLWVVINDIAYAIDGYYYSGRAEGATLTDQEYADELDKQFGKYCDEYSKLKTIVDPSAASFIAELKRHKKYAVIQADNDVLDGIRETASAMKQGKIKVSAKLKEWKTEIEGYVWDEDSGEDRPIKVNDHYMDSMRYFVKTTQLVKPKNQSRPLLLY